MDRSDSRRTRLASTPLLAALALVQVACVLFFCLYGIFYQIPAFGRLLKDTAVDQASTAAHLLAAALVGEDQLLELGGLSPDLLRRIEQVRRQERVMRLRLYSPKGEVVYSTQSGELGRLNRDPYFQDIVIGHKAAAIQAGRRIASLEGQQYPEEIIEAYVPIVRMGRLLGVLELYYDASRQAQRRRHLFGFAAAVQGLAAAVLLAAVSLSAYTALRPLPRPPGAGIEIRKAPAPKS